MTALAVLLVGAFAGCGASTKVSVRVDAKADANAGQPFYLVLRSTEQAEYVTESYESVAARVFAVPPDPSILKAEVVRPGETKKITIEKPATAQTIGLYFLFTKPGDKWKTARTTPFPASVDVTVSGSAIKEES